MRRPSGKGRLQRDRTRYLGPIELRFPVLYLRLWLALLLRLAASWVAAPLVALGVNLSARTPRRSRILGYALWGLGLPSERLAYWLECHVTRCLTSLALQTDSARGRRWLDRALALYGHPWGIRPISVVVTHHAQSRAAFNGGLD